jgi:phage shock protein A
MALIARLWNLVRGAFAAFVRRREQRNPEAVYEAAIQERLQRYTRLREATAGILYLRSKLAAQLERESAEAARLGRQLDVAVDRDDDDAALVLLAGRDAHAAEAARLTAELGELTAEADAAKRNLTAFQDEIARLRDERVRMLARLASARTRLRFQETLVGLSADADIRALEEVREHVSRLVAEVQLVREAGDGELAQRLGRIREAEAARTHRAQLEEMKRSRRPGLVELPQPEAARLTR